MKLIDLLVKELPNWGGWPENVTHIGQDYDRELMFYGRGNVASGIIIDELAIDHRESGKVGVKVTREQYEASLAASKAVVGRDGWIKWAGGDCPVDSDAIVEVKYQNPSLYQFNSDRAGDFYWSHDGFGCDIIAYRLQKPTKSEQVRSGTAETDEEADLNECIGQDVDPPEWNGEGLPPVGTVCMANLANGWTDVKVAYIGDEGGCREALVFEIESTKPAWADEFRPLRTEAEKSRDGFVKLVMGWMHHAGEAEIALIYDAIAAGKIPGVKLEEK